MAVTSASVAAWGRFDVPADAELDLLDTLVDAALEHLARYYALDPLALTATQTIAVTMQVARWWKRRDTPEGRDAFGGDIAVSISAFDADVDAMLQPRPAVA